VPPFPYFFYDLTARVVPGSMFLALLFLIRVPAPEPWTELLWNNHTAAEVLRPVVLVGLAGR
jgi:hypothetical protein